MEGARSGEKIAVPRRLGRYAKQQQQEQGQGQSKQPGWAGPLARIVGSPSHTVPDSQEWRCKTALGPPALDRFLGAVLHEDDDAGDDDEADDNNPG